MPRRVDVDETLPAVAVPRPIVQELLLHAREADPEECCGLVVGDEDERYRRTVRCTNVMTQMHRKDPKNYPRDARQAFFVDPGEWLEVHRQAEKDGERVTAVYHSHVGVGAYLSEEDRAYAETSPFEDADQIVIAVADRRVGGLSLFRWDAERDEFTGHPVETATS